jgi:hypothetical protein
MYLSLPRPPCRWRIAHRNLGRAQRDEMAALVRIAAQFRAVPATHVSFKLVDRRRLRPSDDFEGNGLVRVSPSVGDGCAGPRSPNIRLFQASQASLSASLRAVAARCSEARTELPKARSRDLVPLVADNAPPGGGPTSRYAL